MKFLEVKKGKEIISPYGGQWYVAGKFNGYALIRRGKGKGKLCALAPGQLRGWKSKCSPQ